MQSLADIIHTPGSWPQPAAACTYAPGYDGRQSDTFARSMYTSFPQRHNDQIRANHTHLHAQQQTNSYATPTADTVHQHPRKYCDCMTISRDNLIHQHTLLYTTRLVLTTCVAGP
eukprot:GHUV01020742.1.p3 GENE.GHUV01020742.1~~GHUV01020742.1.p3  ORF type:complete len:115 (-),score=16.91 GHUV01020742.1:701-1045(-)